MKLVTGRNNSIERLKQLGHHLGELLELSMSKEILVNAEALGHVLRALVGPPQHIRELQATRDPIFKDNPIDILVDQYSAFVEKENEKEPELQELLKDKARLDWLADVNNTIGNVTLPRDIVERNLHSLRAAIDDAMAVDNLGRGRL